MPDIERTTDETLIQKLVSPYLEGMVGFDPALWSEAEGGIALFDGKNLALFEYDSPGVYTGHNFFEDRGVAAKQAARAFLETFFTDYDVRLVKGLTPLNKAGALRLTIHLGFTSYGTVETAIGPCELFVMTAAEFKDKT